MSAGPGYQMCVFGRDCFLAWGVAALDLSFGHTIRTETAPGVLEDTTHHFLGCAVGHGAAVGQGVRLAPGAVVPTGATLVAPPDNLFRQWGPHPVQEGAVYPTRAGVVPATKRSAQSTHHALHPLGRSVDNALLGDDSGDETGRRDVKGEVAGG